MTAYINQTLRSIKSNIGQLTVIVLTITIVTCMLFVSVTVGDMFYNVQVSLQSRVSGDTDIKLSGDAFSEAKLDEFCTEYSDDIVYVDKYLQTGGLFNRSAGDSRESKVVLVEAADLRQLYDRHKNSLTIAENYGYSYQYPEVWIGRSFAKENGISAGDVVELYMEYGNVTQKLTVTNIFENYGLFANSVVNNVILDFSTVGTRGILTSAYFSLADNTDINGFIAEVQDYMDNKELIVEPTVDYADVYRVVVNNQTLLNVALVFVIALVLFILFTSYLVLAKNRLNELVTFKAVGATDVQITLFMLVEGAIYGAIGAFIGIILGRFGMGIAVSKVIPNFPDAVQYTFIDYLTAFVGGVAISVAAALFPALKTSKQTIRELISGGVKEWHKPPIWLVVTAVVLLVGCISTIVLIKEPPVWAVVLLAVVAAGMTITVAPYLINVISKLFSGGNGRQKLASVSLKRNPVNQTLTSLIASVIVFTFLVVSIINVIVYAVTPYNERFESDFVVETLGKTDMTSLSSELKTVYGVTDTYYYGYDTFLWENDNEKVEYTAYGVDDADSIKYITDGVTLDMVNSFDSTINPVIISYDLAQRLNLSVGEEIKLWLGNKKEGKKTELYNVFTIVGLDYAMTKDDRVMVIRNSSFVVNKVQYAPENGMIFVITDRNVPKKDLYYDLRDRLSGTGYILEYNDWAYATSVGITGVKTLLRILQIMISAVAFIGIINLTAVTVLDRKKEFQIYSAVGLDNSGKSVLTLCEGLIIGLSGGALGFVLSVVLNRLTPTFAKMIDRFVLYQAIPISIPIIVAVAVAFYSVAYFLISLSQRSRKIERNDTL